MKIMLARYSEENFWDEYFDLEKYGKHKEAKWFYRKFLVITYFKYLFFMYIPCITLTWVVVEKICDFIFGNLL